MCTYKYIDIHIYHRRKFRSQTSDNMDRWKAEMGRVREKRRVEERRSEKRKSQKKEDADARKGRKVAKHCVFFNDLWLLRSKSRLAKAAGAEPSGQMRDEKLHAVAARSTFRSQNAQSTPGSEHFWKLRCRKSARRCGAKHISKSKCRKHTIHGPLLEVEMSKKCKPLWREAHFKVKMFKTHHVRTTFGRSDLVSRGRRKGLCTLSKAKREGFVAFPRTMAGVGHLKRICKDAFSMAEYKVRALISWEGLHFGASDLQVCWDDFAWQVQHFVWPGITFRGRCSTFDRWTGKISKRIGTRPSALPSTFHFWRKSCRIALFLKLSSSKIEEVSQNCFVFDVVNFEKWGSLTEELRFQACR